MTISLFSRPLRHLLPPITAFPSLSFSTVAGQVFPLATFPTFEQLFSPFILVNFPYKEAQLQGMPP
jgi:hypothetical protein